MHPCHVENVARDPPTIEAEAEAEVEYQEEQQSQEFEVAEQVEEQVLETNFANTESQQGKHRFILKPRVFYTSLSFMRFTQIYLCIKVNRI